MLRGHLLVQGVHGHGFFALERVKQGLLCKCMLRYEKKPQKLKLHDQWRLRHLCIYT